MPTGALYSFYLTMITSLICAAASAQPNRCESDIQLTCTSTYEFRDGTRMPGPAGVAAVVDRAEYFDPADCGANLYLQTAEGDLSIAVDPYQKINVELITEGNYKTLVEEKRIGLGSMVIEFPAERDSKLRAVSVQCTYGSSAVLD